MSQHHGRFSTAIATLTIASSLLAPRSAVSDESVACLADEPASDTRPLQAADGLFDAGDKTLGLTTMPGMHTTLYRATEDGYKFCHHPNLIAFGNRLYCMWSNGLVGEDEPGQRILYCSTGDGRKWTEPRLLTDDRGGDGICVAAGFHVHDERLVAYYTVTGGENFHPDTTLFARTSTDGQSWSEPRRITSGFFIEGPSQLPDGRLLLAGERVGKQRESKRAKSLFTDDKGGLVGWREATIKMPELTLFGYTEPSFYQRPGGTVVATLRNYSGHLYCTTSSDRGASWSLPVQTNFPDSTARLSAGNLPDGTAYMINNPGPQRFDRSRLTIAFSTDGVTFDRAHLLRGEPTKKRFEGQHKLDGWQYPHAIVWRNEFYVAYSINKEDVAITRISIKQLTP